MNNIFGVPCSSLIDIAKQSDVPCTDEIEAFGLAYGAMLAGASPIVYMQDSGFCKCLNILLGLYCSSEMPFPTLYVSTRIHPQYHRFVSDKLAWLIQLVNYRTVKIVEQPNV
jgi:sulfopyruvate decarboxylase TPP-binding subunit